jgi:hypothetical protein
VDLRISIEIRYHLCVGDGRDGVSGWVSRDTARSRTCYRRTMREMELAGGGCVEFQRDHVLAMGGRQERRNQLVGVKRYSKITYKLWDHDWRAAVSR